MRALDRPGSERHDVAALWKRPAPSFLPKLRQDIPARGRATLPVRGVACPTFVVLKAGLTEWASWVGLGHSFLRESEQGEILLVSL